MKVNENALVVNNEPLATGHNENYSNASKVNTKPNKQTAKANLEQAQQQLAACKARIHMLETENQDLQNTVMLLRHNSANRDHQ
ncbi:hypothetical protein DPMN_064695 [Dreissena polymorpha]|uniref:Uncharacterized protein n=1 Tax=Dreissena polymorpha TaxID=45954 RepID=A0A9D4CDM0_DREPO|nr:hypothetical protein DPMN_064695 [Dreissena polymorpha]